LDNEGKDHLRRIRASSQRMGQLIDDLLNLSRMTRKEMHRDRVDLSEMARGIIQELRAQEPQRSVCVDIAQGLVAEADPHLIRVVLTNLLGNAWKFTSKRPDARIEFASSSHQGKTEYVVRDNGAGFDMAYVDKLFGAFQRLHSGSEFPGTGIGLATVQRIVHRHGGRAWAQGAVDGGASFHFTI
jgi:light-regulated signal transduction histidine kinase (bacteriophytochrome)